MHIRVSEIMSMIQFYLYFWILIADLWFVLSRKEGVFWGVICISPNQMFLVNIRLSNTTQHNSLSTHVARMTQILMEYSPSVCYIWKLNCSNRIKYPQVFRCLLSSHSTQILDELSIFSWTNNSQISSWF